MKSFFSFFVAFLCTISFVFTEQVQNQDEVDAIAQEAYIFGYPLVMMDMTKQVMTNVAIKQGKYAPLGEFANMRTFPNASFKEITAPNADTLYSFAFVDLQKEPYILHLPDEGSRYYLMPILSAWTNIFESLGTRTTGTKEQNFLIAGPKWSGDVPKDLKMIRAPTNLILLLGRTFCSGTQQDYAKVHDLQSQYTLTPLSYYNKPYKAPKGTINPSIDMQTPVREQVDKMDGPEFFKKFTELMINNPPGSLDKEIVEKMKKIGIEPGKEYNLAQMSPEIQKAISKAPKLAQEKIRSYVKDSGRNENGWQVSIKLGNYGLGYLRRATIAATGFGSNLPDDAMYPTTTVDSNGNRLNGKNKYVLHFEKDELPPVKGFWSLTMYNDDYFFVPNSLNRYALSPQNNLQYNQDGSLDLYIQNTPPGKDKESNWLPSPKDNFILMLRLYWPEDDVLNNRWNPPPVQLIK